MSSRFQELRILRKCSSCASLMYSSPRFGLYGAIPCIGPDRTSPFGFDRRVATVRTAGLRAGTFFFSAGRFFLTDFFVDAVFFLLTFFALFFRATFFFEATFFFDA